MTRGEALWNRLETASIYGLAIILLILGTIIDPAFLSSDNLLGTLKGIAILGMVASGMAFVTYSGSMADLSLPAIMAFSGIVTVASLPLGLFVAVVLGIGAGMLIGAINGLVVGKFNANPILWTLAVAFFMEGFMRFTGSGNQVYPDTEAGTAGAAFIEMYRWSLGPIPAVVVVMLAMFVIAHLVMRHTRFGRECRLVGSSRPAALASGINVSRVTLGAFLVASLAASIAGILITSMTKLGVFYLGQGYDFKAVTAVVIGGVMLSGGRGHMIGVLGGVLVIGLLTNIMNIATFVELNSFEQQIVTGIVFISVVGFQQTRLRKKGRDFA